MATSMTAAGVLAQAYAAGLVLTAEGDRLRWRGPPPPPEVLAGLRGHKAEVLALLAVNDVAPILASASPEWAQAEREDRAAIEAVDGGADPTRWRLVDHMRHAAHLRRLQAVAMQRPPSWPDPEAVPSAGCWCSCCRAAHWWRERATPRGWRCWACHPPVPDAAVVEVRT